MAINNNGTKNNLPTNQIPVGYTKPTITPVTGVEYPRELELDVLKATVENVDPVVTMANILNDAAIGINKQIDDILAGDFIATNTVDAYAILYAMETNFGNLDSTGDYLTTAAPKYVCKVRLYIKTS